MTRNLALCGTLKAPPREKLVHRRAFAGDGPQISGGLEFDRLMAAEQSEHEVCLVHRGQHLSQLQEKRPTQERDVGVRPRHGMESSAGLDEKSSCGVYIAPSNFDDALCPKSVVVGVHAT